MVREFKVSDLAGLLKLEYRVIGNPENVIVRNARPIHEASIDSLVWVSPLRKDKQELVSNTKAKLIISDDSLDFSDELRQNKCFIVVENPKITFINLVAELFEEKIKYEIHPTAHIHPEAEVHADTFVGPFTYIGKSKIDEGTIIDGNVYIYDNVKIGKNVKIQSGCVIGAAGLNITKNDEGSWVEFPHIGGVTIEDDVRIDVLTHIDRGTLGDTFIGKGTKIDNCAYIAHNAKIGNNTIIIGHTMISGSVNVGKNCWLGASTVVRDGNNIGDNCFVGMGSLIVKDVEDQSNIMGSPARPINAYKKLLKELKKLIK